MDAKKNFLVDISRIFRRTQKVQCNPEHTVIVSADEDGKSLLVTPLSRPNQGSLIHKVVRPSWKGYGIHFHHRQLLQTGVPTNR